MNKRIAIFAAIAVVAGIGGFLAARAVDTRPTPASDGQVWTDATWPFPLDQWGEGWAFQCKAADCGTDVNLYVRPKIGFCNCQTGVADDPELERVSDLDLVGSERSALGPGRPIKVLWMKGRSRSYKVTAPSPKSVLSLAFNNRCDVIVATVITGDKAAAQERAVLEFLNSDMMREWAEAALGPPIGE